MTLVCNVKDPTLVKLEKPLNVDKTIYELLLSLLIGFEMEPLII